MTDVTAFDADVLIYAAAIEHPLGAPVLDLVRDGGGVGSVLLLPEVLAKPMRSDPQSAEVEALARILAALQLVPFDEETAQLAAVLGAKYGLWAADAAHLATAVAAGADRFITNNRKDFSREIDEIDIVYPDMLR